MSFRTAIVPFVGPVDTGIVRYYAALGGLTPKVAIAVISNNNPIDVDNPTASMTMGVGATDGTRQFSASTRAQSSLTSSNVYRHSRNDALILKVSSALDVITYQASFSAWGSDYIDINWTTVGTAPLRGFLVLMAGTELTAYVGSVNLGTGTSQLSITEPAFQPQALMTFGIQSAVNTPNVILTLMLGLAADDGSSIAKKVVAWAGLDNINPTAPRQHMASAHIAMQQAVATNTVDYFVTLDEFNSNGFKITPSANGGSDDVFYIAMKFNGRPVKVWDFSTPTATGNASDTTPGFKPVFGLVVGSYLTALDTSTGAAGSSALSISAFRADIARALTGREKWGASPTSADSLVAAKAVAIPSDSSATAIQATLVSMDSSGWTLNYSAVDSTGRKAFALAIGGADESEVFISKAQVYARLSEAPAAAARPRIAWIM